MSRQPRTVGQAIVPGHHIRNLFIAKNFPPENFYIQPTTSSGSGSPDASMEDSRSSEHSGNGSERMK